MSRVVVSEYVSLDGVMDEPGRWSMPFFDDEVSKFKYDELFASDALLLGRLTYEGFAAAWPTMTDEQGFAQRMNSLPKYVASTTLTAPEWNATVIEGDIAGRVAELKRQPGGDLLVGGSGTLVRSLMEHDLVDEYRLLVHPIVLGAGKRLFADGMAQTVLDLVDARAFGSGVVALTYRPRR
jgi:dihydrofolate reductase